MICNVCDARAVPCMEAQVLGKYKVVYYQCTSCQFVQTETPYWLDEAYSNAISSLDVGLIYRNELTVDVVQAVIHKWFDRHGRFVDYGGGYGMLVRMMRDRGFDFYRYDTHCENLFAKTFDALPSPAYSLLTAFEVFEHLVAPKADLAHMLQYSRNILFSTEVQPAGWKPADNNWWYVLPETGQHIALYSTKSLQVLAEQNGLHYVAGENNMHMLSESPVSKRWFTRLTNQRGAKVYNLLFRTSQPSLLGTDFTRLREAMMATTPQVK